MSEILKSLWGKLYGWALPSALFLGATWLFLLPQLTCRLNFSELVPKDEEGLAFVVLTGALAISLSSLSTQLYRFLEGYSWPRWLQDWGLKRQHARKKALRTEIAGVGWRRGIAQEELARYPLDDSQIVPTRFGNAIRAFETYGKTRFNMDSQTLWHELLAVAPKYIQTEIDSTRSSVDFFVALLYLSIIFGFACWTLAAIEHFQLSLLLLSVPAFALAALCHTLAIRAIDAWSYPVHALVNLGRVKLAAGLGLTLPKTVEEEKTMWGLVTKYAYSADREHGEALNAYRIFVPERRAEERDDEEVAEIDRDHDEVEDKAEDGGDS
jgi:hypothetical protein